MSNFQVSALDRAFLSPWLDSEILWGSLISILLLVFWALGMALPFSLIWGAFVYLNLSTYGKCRVQELIIGGDKSYKSHFTKIDLRIVSKLFFLTVAPFAVLAGLINAASAMPYADIIAGNNSVFVDFMVRSLPFNMPALERYQKLAGEDTATITLSMFCYTLVISFLLIIPSVFGCVATFQRSFKYREANFYTIRNQNFRAFSIVVPICILIIIYNLFDIKFEQIFGAQFVKMGNHSPALYVDNLLKGSVTSAFIPVLANICILAPMLAVFYSFIKREIAGDGSKKGRA